MNKLAYSFTSLLLVAGAAHAQPAAEAASDAAAPAAHGAAHAEAAPPPAPAEQAAEAAAPTASRAIPQAEAPAPAAAPVLTAADVTDAEIDSFAKATVKLQAIQSDTTISADLRPAAMRAAVTEAGLDPAKYNAIGKAAQADAALRAKVQTAMTRYAAPPSG